MRPVGRLFLYARSDPQGVGLSCPCGRMKIRGRCAGIIEINTEQWRHACPRLNYRGVENVRQLDNGPKCSRPVASGYMSPRRTLHGKAVLLYNRTYIPLLLQRPLGKYFFQIFSFGRGPLGSRPTQLPPTAGRQSNAVQQQSGDTGTSVQIKSQPTG